MAMGPSISHGFSIDAKIYILSCGAKDEMRPRSLPTGVAACHISDLKGGCTSFNILSGAC
jgi:hypothetical protein